MECVSLTEPGALGCPRFRKQVFPSAGLWKMGRVKCAKSSLIQVCELQRQGGSDLSGRAARLGLRVLALAAWLPRVVAQQRIGGEFPISVNSNTSLFPDPTGLDNGNFVVTWSARPQQGIQEIMGQVFDAAGTEIGNNFQMNTFTVGNQVSSLVTGLRNGNFASVWWSDDQDGSGFGVFGQLFDASGVKLGTEFQVNSYTTGDQYYASMSTLADGFVVVWASDDQDGSSLGVFGQRFFANASRLGSEFQANTYTTDVQREPAVSELGNNGFVVVWTSRGQDGSSEGIYGQRFDLTGAKAGSEFQINTYTADVQALPSVAGLDNGNFVVTWSSDNQDGSGSGVFGQIFDGSGSKLGTEFQINTYTSGLQGTFTGRSIAGLMNGHFVGIWASRNQDGDGFGVFGQVFDGIGGMVGNEFAVNTYTTGNQYFSSVASLQNGEFVVVWVSEGQAGPYSAVYGQLFQGPGGSSGATSGMGTSAIASSAVGTSGVTSTTGASETSAASRLEPLFSQLAHTLWEGIEATRSLSCAF